MWRMPYIARLLLASSSFIAAVGVLWFLLVEILQFPTLFYLVLVVILLKAGRQFGTN